MKDRKGIPVPHWNMHIPEQSSRDCQIELLQLFGLNSWLKYIL